MTSYAGCRLGQGVWGARVPYDLETKLRAHVGMSAILQVSDVHPSKAGGKKKFVIAD